MLRCRLSELALERGIGGGRNDKAPQNRRGTIVNKNLATSRYAHVLWDGNKAPTTLAKDYITIDDNIDPNEHDINPNDGD